MSQLSALPALHATPPPDAGGMLERLMAIKSMAQQQQIQAQQAPLQQEALGQENQQRQIQLNDQQAMSAAMRQWDGKDPDQLPSLVIKAGGSANAVMGLRNSIIDYKTKASTLTSDQIKNINDENDIIDGHFEAVKGAPAEGKQEAWASAIQDLQQKGVVQPGQLPPQYPGDEQISLLEKQHMGQKAILSKAQSESMTAKNTAQAAEAQTGAAKNTAQVAWYQQHPEAGAQGVPPETISAADWLAKHPGKTFSDYTIEMKKIVPQFTFNMQQGALQSSAIDLAAQNYLQTGQMPTGMRSPAMSSLIINRAGELAKENPALANLASNRAAYEANKSSFENVTKTLDTLSAFENTGLKNLKRFTDLAAKIPDTGVPWINTPVRNLSDKAVGSANMAAVNAARMVALREIARVTNDPKLSGVLSDSARQEVSSLVPTNATFAQIKAVANVLQNDMANVHGSLSSQKADIAKRMGMPQGAVQQQAPAPVASQGGGGIAQAPAAAPKIAIGQKVTLKSGKTVTVTSVHPDGSFDAK